MDHTTVLLERPVAALVTDPDGFYVDGTFGRGGHSRALLARLSERGGLLAIDKDPEACAAGRDLFGDDSRFEIVQGSFAELADLIAARNRRGRVNGVLLDLGVSSPQLDNAERGFSFLRDGPLDMRMDPSSGISAAVWLATATEDAIAETLKIYGEEKFSRRMARAIIAARTLTPITRTLHLADIVAAANPAWERGKHPATRAFQAMRIFINRELDDLQVVLAHILDVLAVGGRLAVISFHSLEDRLVKRFLRDHERPHLPKGLPVMERDVPRRMRALGRAIKPSAEEVAANPRARSAVLRIAEKVA
ncbi:MAG: 16S rRNA (cytosine(1402)-N(4))-methyltransferase RsmH [Porticoccaceae bacterium]